MAQNPLGLDPKHYKYLKSDDKTTTLKHKQGHLLTIAHAVLSPKMQAVLKAMAPKEDQELQEKASGGMVKEIHPDESEPGYTEKPKMAAGGLTPNGTPAEYGLPCLNPNCKSHGRPHPNCRCYGFATGGKVGSVCKEKREHHPDCEYYADGGTTEQTPEQQESQRDTEEAAGRAYDQLHGTAPKEPQHATMNPTSWWSKGGPVEQKTVGTISGKPFAKGGPARKAYNEGSDEQPVSQDDSAPKDYGPKGPVHDAVSNALDTLVNHFKRGGAGGEAKYAREEKANPAPTSTAGEDTPPMIYPDTPEQNQQDQQRFSDLSTQFDPTAGQPTPAAPTPQPAPDTDTAPPEQAQTQDTTQTPAPTPPPPASRPISKADALTSDLNKEADAVALDFKNGHITPKTYHDLLANNADGTPKSTLGRIGALFGLLLSGAGSGLSHQPNAVLEMMNKTIDNDLQAQKAQKDTQLNFLRLNQEHIRDNAYKAQTGAYTGLLQAQGIGANINNDLLATQLTKNQMMLGALQHIYGLADNLPPGNAKAAATNTAAGVEAAVRQHIAQENARVAQTITGNEKTNYQNNIKQLRMAAALGDPTAGHAADVKELHHFPGVYQDSTIPIDLKDKDHAQSLYNLNDLFNRSLQFAQAPLTTKASLKYRQAADALHGQLIAAIKQAQQDGVYKPSEAKFILGQIGDSPASVFAAYNAVPKLKELQIEKQNEYNNLLKKYEFEPQQLQGQIPNQPQSQPQNNVQAMARAWATDPKNAKDPRSKKILDKLKSLGQ